VNIACRPLGVFVSELPPIFKLPVLEEVEELNPRLVFHHLLKGIRAFLREIFFCRKSAKVFFSEVVVLRLFEPVNQPVNCPLPCGLYIFLFSGFCLYGRMHFKDTFKFIPCVVYAFYPTLSYILTARMSTFQVHDRINDDKGG